jgi:hypothetical protein
MAIDKMPDLGTRVRVPWEMETRDGVVTNQLGEGTAVPRVKVRVDGEGEADFRLDQIDLAPDTE